MSFRDSFSPEVGGLGKKVEREVEPPLAREISPGIVKGTDGMWHTALPMPKAPPIPVPDVVILEDWPAIWPFPEQTIYRMANSEAPPLVALDWPVAVPVTDDTPAFPIADED
jgi:hypothetical protein